MIFSFKCQDTKELWDTGKNRRIPPDIQRVALRKLTQLHTAKLLTDLRIPPNNRLESLNYDRLGQYSIRINSQWRICFVWEDGQIHHVEIIDYH